MTSSSSAAAEGPDLRPARPVRRRRSPDPSPNGEATIESAVRDGLAAIAHRQEELAELLESAIDHLLVIERRLDALEAAAAPPAEKPAKRPAIAKKAKPVAATTPEPAPKRTARRSTKATTTKSS